MSSDATTKTKVYLITGANRGIGLALVNYLLSNTLNSDIFVYAGVRDITSTVIQTLATQHPGKVDIVEYVAGDVNKNKAIADRIQKRHGYVDVVIACAGISSFLGPTVETPPEAMREHYEVNVIGPLVLFQATYNLLKASIKTPKFIPLTTVGASLTAFIDVPLGLTCYGASKAGLNYLARRIHFENDWIVCFPLSPGIVKTDMAISNREMDKTGTLAKMQDQMQVEPEEAAARLIEVIEGSTREKEGGEFMNVDGSKVAW